MAVEDKETGSTPIDAAIAESPGALGSPFVFPARAEEVGSSASQMF